MTLKRTGRITGVGVLGCADIAWRRTLPAITGNPLLRLVGVASRNGAKAQKFADEFGCEAIDGYDRLIDRDDIDAVYVPLPAGLHAQWVERALRAGKHVLAEKPLTTDAATTRGLVELARARGLLLMENFMFTHHSQHAAVRGLVTDGTIGELRAFHAAFTIPRLPDDDIRHQPALGGGALLDVGGYPLKAAELFLGGGLRVVGSILREDLEHGVDMGGTTLLVSPSGVTAQLTFGMDNAYRSSYELWGSEGRIGVYRAFTPPSDHRPVVVLERRGSVEEIILDADDQFARIVSVFAQRIADGTGFDADAADILAHAELVDEVRRLSVRTRAGRAAVLMP
ncbi:Gfo/Idh/MocA family protein [Kitasatospora sp. NBC_01302]|uniref:Gfo/Idh/MocA family protein n=1 Tax=Kitasatospora sp. NBC_01302 TaxID=2903575 RepID=UPI002E12FC8A|nr:Gfo/Idh/MocA family oxidoreductase [Kitasatospora sp. NBC_01302]